ncbi:MAG: NADP-dependent phosphogluconate dehydrogenase [Candidatus Peribacteraceae bacterium]|nr:NADP-dependent phosphogluconate dehydrogenase [Candidatus Peribacteraceae bacterium]
MTNLQLGVIGLAVMGSNLARNAARNGATVAVFNRTGTKTDEFLAAHGGEGTFVGTKTLAEFVAALERPRPILLMVKAGQPVDDVLDELLPLLEKGDIIIDAGNSHYRDTERRFKRLKEEGLHFVGMGVSGGEEGALKGPSMMPGADKEAYEALAPLLLKMAASDGDAGTCAAFMGEGGAGHFVKMVHNGIEYGIMQLIAECYHILKQEGGLTNAQLAETFAEWNAAEPFGSFLLEITVEIFQKKDPETGADLLDLILDKAAQKGTGKWTVEAGFLYGASIPTITAATDARIASSAKEFRAARSTVLTQELLPAHGLGAELSAVLKDAYLAAVAQTYAQGLQLLTAASEEEKWNLDISEICRIWRGGCIIRSQLLPLFQAAFKGEDKAIRTLRELCIGEPQKRWRQVVALGAERGIPLPAFSSALSYFDAYRSEWLPQNLIQAQRDFFGAHTYERTDKQGTFHTQW